MTREPDFRELVGDEGSPEELERLRRVHELLLSADPPAELTATPQLPASPRPRAWSLPRPRLQAAFGLAAAAVLALAFGLGYVLGNNGSGFSKSFSVPMHGIGANAAASATIDIAKRDANGNWPMVVTVRGLPKLPKGSYYELYLTKHGKPGASCGSFNANGSITRVHLTAPYEFSEYDGWVVVTHAPSRPDQTLLTT